ncbi:MAG: zinc ribbon domain-containing protein [Azoarcus sp.]|nr:zinc ribbon domain-containing protein [Azoarcus sp.]
MNQNMYEKGIFFSGLSNIPKALRNEKALFSLLVTGLVAMILAFLGRNLGGFAGIMLSLLILLTVLPFGASVAGLLLMDQAREQTPRPLRKAISDGIPVYLRILGIALLGLVPVAIFILFLGILLLICKIPHVGPVLYAVLFPVLLISSGLLCFGFMAGLSMASPAIWAGATFRETLEILRQIANHRGLELLVNLLLLTVLISLAQFLLAGLAVVGSPPVVLTSTTILGIDPLAFLNSAVASHMVVLKVDSHVVAAAFGLMTVLVLVLAVTAAMAMMGLSLIYLRITKDLSSLETMRTAAPHKGTDQKEPIPQPPPWSIETGDNHPAAGIEDILASPPAETPPAATMADNAKTAPICPRCKVAAQPGDRFCGECGGNLHG